MQALTIAQPAPDASTTGLTDAVPPQPLAGEVTIDVAYAGINFIDVMARRGDPGYAKQWPFTPGLEVAGTVRAVGAGVAAFRPGDRVAALTPAGGGLAEVALASDSLTVAVPDDVPLQQAAAAPLMLASAVLLVRDVARLQDGDTLLMHSAAGGIGSAVAQVAKATGAHLMVGTVGNADKVPDARKFGWDIVFPRNEDVVAAVREIAPGGIDVILDPTGTAMLDSDLAIAAPGARIVLFGNAGGGSPAALPGLGQLIGGNVGILGFSMSRLSATAPQRVAEALARGLWMIVSGSVALAPTVVESLTGVGAVHDQLATGQGIGKYVVRVGA